MSCETMELHLETFFLKVPLQATVAHACKFSFSAVLTFKAKEKASTTWCQFIIICCCQDAKSQTRCHKIFGLIL